MGAKVPIIQGVKVPTTISMLTSKSSKYRYSYLRIPVSMRALIEGRFFEVKLINNHTVYYVLVSKPTPTSYKPRRVGNSLYIRLPKDVKQAKHAVIELVEDGFIVHIL